MRKNLKKIVALSMSVFMVGSMLPVMNVVADDAPATVRTVNSDFINGDFEKGLEPWQIQSNRDAFEVVEGGEGHALKVTASSKAVIRNTAWFVEPSTEYVISYETKLEGEGSVSISKHEFTAAWSLATGSISDLAKVTTTGDEFKKASYKFTTNADTAFVQIDLVVNGNALIDNVTITKAEPAVAEVDFSNTDGWTGVSAAEKTGTKPIISKNIVLNEGFEENSTFVLGQSNKAEISSEKANSGNSAIKIQGGNGGDNWGKALLNVWYDFEPSTEYKISAKIYTDDEAALTSVLFSNSLSNAKEGKWGVHSAETLATGLTKGEWTTFESSFKTSNETVDLNQLQLCVRPSTDVTVYIDDVQIYKEVSTDVDVYSDGVGAFGKDGDAALKLESIDKVSYEASKLVEGTTYEYSYDVKVEDAGEGFEFSTSLDDKKVTANTDWTTVTGTFVAGESKNIDLNRAGTGVVYFDNLTVNEVVNIHVHHGAPKEYGATCKEDSKRVYECEDCGGNVYVEYTGDYPGEGFSKALGHDFSVKSETVEPTETEKGYTVYKCSRCDETEKRDWKDAKKDETTTVAPETTTVAPETTTKVPETTTKAPETTTKAPETTTKAPETTTVAPETTTKAPETTTKAPETTTKAPETTTELKAPSQVKKVKLTAKKKSLKVTWKKVTGVKKYQVQICTSKKFKKGVIKKNASKNSLTVKKLKARKKYYVRVRAVKTSGKKTAYGKWSNVVNKKTK